MDAPRLIRAPVALTWEYDQEADVLCVAAGDRRPAVTVDLGESVLARYDEDRSELVGLAILDLHARLRAGLPREDSR